MPIDLFFGIRSITTLRCPFIAQKTTEANPFQLVDTVPLALDHYGRSLLLPISMYPEGQIRRPHFDATQEPELRLCKKQF